MGLGCDSLSARDQPCLRPLLGLLLQERARLLNQPKVGTRLSQAVHQSTADGRLPALRVVAWLPHAEKRADDRVLAGLVREHTGPFLYHDGDGEHVREEFLWSVVTLDVAGIAGRVLPTLVVCEVKQLPLQNPPPIRWPLFSP